MDLFATLGEVLRPMPVESIAERVNAANNRMFARMQQTRLAEKWIQWGLRPDSSDKEIDCIIDAYQEYLRDKGTGRL